MSNKNLKDSESNRDKNGRFAKGSRNSINPDYRFELSNIITVCQSCHNWIHSKENTKNEFLS